MSVPEIRARERDLAVETVVAVTSRAKMLWKRLAVAFLLGLALAAVAGSASLERHWAVGDAPEVPVRTID